MLCVCSKEIKEKNKISIDLELMQSDPIFRPQYQKGKNYIHKPAIAAMHGPHSLVRFGD